MNFRDLWIVSLALIAAGTAVPARAAPVALSSVISAPIEGTWQTQQGTEITIEPCDGGYCGRLTWIVIPKENSTECLKDKTVFGTLMMDYSNPDKALQTRPIVGLEMMKLQATADPGMFNGQIYNLQDGKTYDGQIQVIDGDTLRLGNGCAFNVCVVSQDWPRVPVRDGPPDFICSPG